jgi:hypothetical protein
MSVLTQGTQLYVYKESTQQLMEIDCISSFNPGSSPADQIETTCLSERSTRSYQKGLRTPGQGTLTLNPDPGNVSHLFLSQSAESADQEDLVFAVGWSDGEDAPAIDEVGSDNAVDGLLLPEDRSWYVFKGYVSDFPFDFEANTVVQSAGTIQRSGAGIWVTKATEEGS